MGLHKLFVNLTRGDLVLSASLATPFALPSLKQGDTPTFEITFVEEAPAAGLGKVTILDMAGYSLRVGVGAAPIGNTTVSPAALQSTWTWDAAAKKFTGTLPLNTAEITTLIGAASSKVATLEIELKETATGFYDTAFQGPVTLLADLIEDVPLAPVSGGTQLSIEQADATYVKKRGKPGESFSLVNAAGTYEVIFYVDDNGTFRTETIPYVA